MHYTLGQRRDRPILRPIAVLSLAGLLLGSTVAAAMPALSSAPHTGAAAAATRIDTPSLALPLAVDTVKKDRMTHNPNTSVAGAATPASVQLVQSNDCTGSGPARTGLENAVMPQLRKLKEYEAVCSAAVSRLSFFVGTPRTVAEAKEEAAWVAANLKELARYKVAPLVFMEPVSASGLLDAKQYRAGAYDAALDAYFAALKANGVTEAAMGMWVPWPEANIPVWTSVDPGDFAANVTKAVQAQKRHFPASKAAVLLQSMTYPSAGSWDGGAYVSLVPYVRSIPAGLIDSFGLQGFAWPPTAPNEPPQLDAKQFLRIDFAAEAARTLGVRQVWFNTGVFSMSFVVKRNSPYALNAQQRQAVLKVIAGQARALKDQGFEPAVHIFAENKGATAEGIDWSYWPAGHMFASPSTSVFRAFAADLQAADMPLWLYDSAGE